VTPTPEPVVLTGHGSAVTCGAFSADGKTLATGSYDNTVKVWDVAEHRERLTLKGHTGGVKAVLLSPDGKTVFSAGEDRTVRVWDATTGKETHTFGPNRFGVEGLSLSPDGKALAAGCGDWKGSEPGEVKVYDLAAGKEKRVLTGHPRHVVAVAFSPDGKVLVSVGGDGTLKVWDAATLAERKSLTTSASSRALTFSPDGKTLAQAHWINEEGADERANLAVTLWDTATWKERGQCRGHRAQVFGVSFAPDGRTLATASKDGTAQLWDLPMKEAPPSGGAK